MDPPLRLKANQFKTLDFGTNLPGFFGAHVTVDVPTKLCFTFDETLTDGDEPERDDAEMFFTNVFSYSDRRRLCEHAYQKTREDLRRRHSELSETFGRHGVTIDDEALADEHRTLFVRGHRKSPPT